MEIKNKCNYFLMKGCDNMSEIQKELDERNRKILSKDNELTNDELWEWCKVGGPISEAQLGIRRNKQDGTIGLITLLE
jgi:hypothetical protein